MPTPRFGSFRFLLGLGAAGLLTSCVVYPDGTAVLLPPPPVIVAPAACPYPYYRTVYGGPYFYGTSYYGRRYYPYAVNRPYWGWGGGGWGGYRGGAYYRGGSYYGGGYNRGGAYYGGGYNRGGYYRR